MINDCKGFTLLELMIVLVLVMVTLSIAAVFVANTLPASRFNATVREVSATIRHARALAQLTGERKTVTLDLDAKQYGIDDRGAKNIPPDVGIKILDLLSGEILEGKYYIAFHPNGSIEGGTIVLWSTTRTVSIQMDPIVGAVVIK